MTGKLTAEHGVVCRQTWKRLGYFGWPTVARLEDGTLVVASSGLRSAHICPWGRTVLNYSKDGGTTWSGPEIINDSPIDDRDAGVISLGRERMLVSWFRSDTRQYLQNEWARKELGEKKMKSWLKMTNTWTEEMVKRHIGSWIKITLDGGASWCDPVRVPVSAPHGPIMLRSGDLLYLGKRFVEGWDEMVNGRIVSATSSDGGWTWKENGEVPVYPETTPANYHEPHILELPSGKIIGMIRIENHGGSDLAKAGVHTFSMMQASSEDRGKTWSTPTPLAFHGSPPHLMRHSSGTIVLTYGYRQSPFGQRVAFSKDEGKTWDHDWIIRDDGPDSDLGYPSTVELPDGRLFTVCYQKAAAGEHCSLLWSRWTLP